MGRGASYRDAAVRACGSLLELARGRNRRPFMCFTFHRALSNCFQSVCAFTFPPVLCLVRTRGFVSSSVRWLESSILPFRLRLRYSNHREHRFARAGSLGLPSRELLFGVLQVIAERTGPSLPSSRPAAGCRSPLASAPECPSLNFREFS